MTDCKMPHIEPHYGEVTYNSCAGFVCGYAFCFAFTDMVTFFFCVPFIFAYVLLLLDIYLYLLLFFLKTVMIHVATVCVCVCERER